VFSLSVAMAQGAPPSWQSEEQAQSAEDDATQQAGVAQDLPIPIPVQIIEDDEASVARERSEAEARQREKDDLLAQQGMEIATREMNDATQRQLLYTMISTALVAVGTTAAL
jgi:hypothetical protein